MTRGVFQHFSNHQTVNLQSQKIIMQSAKRLFQRASLSFIALAAVLYFAGCQSDKNSGGEKTAVAPATPAVVAVPAVTPPPATAFKAVRIKADSTEPLTDADGNVWLPDQGFSDSSTAERSDLQIANTKTPAIYMTERYSMDSFSYPLPNGKYIVKLHFCETYEDITGPGQRVFTFNVQGHEFKDFDIFVKAGGALRAYIETVPVEITDGKLLVTFTSQVENPEINGIEILPAP
jgi:hypothetical protein